MNQEVDENDYKCEEAIEHIYNRPDMILSSDDHILRNVDVYNFETGLVGQMETDTPPAVIQLFVEAVANAADHIQRSRLKDYPERKEGLPSVEVDMTPQKISIKNYGLAVPVNPHEVYKVPTPQFLFGSLRSSSNYSGVRTGIGRNGYGIKAVNIFSTLFELRIVNAVRKVSYYQTWSNRMGSYTNPVVEPCEEEESSVTITYTLDFERFQMKEYDSAYYGIAAHLVQSLSCSSKIITRFNEFVFDKRHILDYAACLHPPEALATAIVHYEVEDPKTQKVVIVDGRPILTSTLNKIVLPRVEAVIIDPSFTKPKIDSFANGMPTDDGGVHVDAFLNQIIPRIVKYVNTCPREEDEKKKENTKKGKTGKDKGKDKKKEIASTTGVKIKTADVRPSMAILLFVRVVDPKFDSQIKSRLRSPTPSISIPMTTMETIFAWDFMNRLKAILKGLEIHSLTKTDGSKTGFVELKKGFDANEAGKKKWRDCTLIVTEGDSAMAYAIAWISKFEKGRDFYGVIPLRGKPLNTRKALPKKIVENKEIELLKKILGLKEGQKSIEGLRYSRLMIMADADDDGCHIKSLISNLFDHLYPDLLASGFIIDYRTKYLLAKKKGTEKFFYTQNEYEEWKKITPDWKTWNYSYYKGLGTNGKEGVIADAQNPKMVDFTMTETGKEMFQILFSKGRSNERKEWYIRAKEMDLNPYILQSSVTYTEFFDRELSCFVTTALHRAIPKMSDGLKHSQRQIIWGVMKSFSPGSSFKQKKIKVAQLSGTIAQCVAYRHNEECLSKAIINLAQDFMGSNNVPLLVPDGQFGTRIKCGKDHASPRYIYTYPSEWLYLIFRPEDTPILNREIDDGIEVEPTTFYPIVPICLLNGTEGIATGWSTSVPAYHPLDIVNYILWWLTDRRKKVPELIPSYAGFKGETKLIKDAPFDPEAVLFMGENIDEDEGESEFIGGNDDEGKQEEKEEIISIAEGEEVPTPPSKQDIVEFTGTFTTNDDNSITVTELPPGRWFQKYYLWLQKLKKEKKISSYKDYTSEAEAKYIITGMERPTTQKLNLVKRYFLSNLTLLNEKDVPVRYKNVQEYLHEFCAFRLGIYKKRRAYYLRHLTEKLKAIQDKITFLELVSSGKIVISNREESEIKEDMRANNVDPSMYGKLYLSELGKEGLIKNRKDLETYTQEKTDYEKYSASDLWKNELRLLMQQIKKDPRLNRTYGIEVQYAK